MTIISASSFAKNFEDRKREVLPQIQSSISDPDVSEHPFDESVCKELESYIIGNNISTASTRESHNLIQSFLDRLKRFVGEQGFDNMGFVSVHKRIHRELSYIWCWVKNEPQSEKVGKMFKFSTKMFLSMTEAAEIFRFYSIDTRYHYLVRNIGTQHSPIDIVQFRRRARPFN
ncbi:hypothetical protein JCM33374_g3991 [Metschnikowia sp. JCM 33374]|nr:hypothetical protein JCM33374_g3991 [Metschnikowia sp. JCM 33374]